MSSDNNEIIGLFLIAAQPTPGFPTDVLLIPYGVNKLVFWDGLVRISLEVLSHASRWRVASFKIFLMRCLDGSSSIPFCHTAEEIKDSNAVIVFRYVFCEISLSLFYASERKRLSSVTVLIVWCDDVSRIFVLRRVTQVWLLSFNIRMFSDVCWSSSTYLKYVSKFWFFGGVIQFMIAAQKKRLSFLGQHWVTNWHLATYRILPQNKKNAAATCAGWLFVRQEQKNHSATHAGRFF